MASDGDGPSAKLERLRTRTAALEEQLERHRRAQLSERQRMWKELSDSEVRAAVLQAHLAAREAELAAILRSRSWRITAPLRRFVLWLRSLRDR